MRNIELLIPAGSPEVLKTAVLYGADAVYIGGEQYGLRAKAKNFSEEEMEESIAYAHACGVRVYVTANIVAHNDDLDGLKAYFRRLRPMKPDALIVSDPGVFAAAKSLCPEIPIHISTQANSTNYETYRFWHALGAARVVAARELSLTEIAEIRARIPKEMEIEVFVHGAMCISHSGRCLLSNYFTGRDANRGACTHPCRWRYYVMEETRPGEFLPVEENDQGTFLFNSRDLCMIEHIPDLIRAGADSFKIEGRMKNALYVAAVTRTYRRAIDDYRESPACYEAHLPYYREEIAKCTYRRFTTGFYYDKPGEDAQIYDANTYVKEYIYIGIVQDVDEKGFVKIRQKNKFLVGDILEAMLPDGTNRSVKVLSMEDENRLAVDAAPHPKQVLWIDFGEALKPGWVLRMKAPARPDDPGDREDTPKRTGEDPC